MGTRLRSLGYIFSASYTQWMLIDLRLLECNLAFHRYHLWTFCFWGWWMFLLVAWTCQIDCLISKLKTSGMVPWYGSSYVMLQYEIKCFLPTTYDADWLRENMQSLELKYLKNLVNFLLIFPLNSNSFKYNIGWSTTHLITRK